ncbi:MAG: FAD binding domain-containing protein [Saccharofermentanales bacterium]
MVNGYFPKSLHEALEMRAAGDAIPYAGGTDLMIEGDRDACYLFLHRIPALKQITEDREFIRVGACCTFTQIADHPLAPALLKEAVLQIAAPAIRNFGTVGGNIANGSPKADSALIFYVTDSILRLVSSSGERLLPIKDFYIGRKQLALAPDELIAEILIPRSKTGSYYYKKVGARNAQAISRVAFAALSRIEDDRILDIATAFGAVSDMIIRRDDLDAMLKGRTLAESKVIRPDYLKAFDQAIVPIRGRISAEYRKDVCMNLLRDFLDTIGV